jgi:hypothetical protein
MDRPRPDRHASPLAGLEALERRGGHHAVAVPVAPNDWPDDRPGAPTSMPSATSPPAALRHRVRRRGPFAALVPPALIGAVAIVVLQGSTSTARGVLGFVLAVLAAPLLPAFGVPLRTGSGAVTAAVAASALLWFVLGVIAAARATRHLGGWGRYWVEYLWLAACAWSGALLALVAANLVLGRVLL